MPSAFAQTTTGNISGTVTTSQGNTKLAGVGVAAVSPTGRYSTTSDQSGFFSFSGVAPDTYAITFTTKGYETYTLTGITVVQGGSVNASIALNKTLTTIGRTQARSQSGAFQPAQTTDQYNVGAPQ
ncbi:MAG: carboxypeptidase-like regulatory domain-containing protein, partial [Candidatus Eremiobacteraeota bacterium]|nr:carboxypeptidase-like regulatory domain-containing protein [Candidatus Eremiobacteraeota bacterium]